MSGSPKHVVVVGGGVIGAFCAYYLTERGARVTLLERGEFGRACSHANCGFVSPSHVLPLAAPGAIGSTLRAMLRPNSAFSIRPRFDPALWSWLLSFARKCNERDMLAGAEAIKNLLKSSRSLYDEVLAKEAIDCEFDARGLLFVFQTPHAMEHYVAVDKLLRESFATPATRYSGDELVQLEPALRPGLAGAWHYESDAHLRPDRLMAGLKKLLLARGVTLTEQTEVTSLQTSGESATALVTNSGETAADAFVFATGAFTPRLSHALGCKLPIQPGKGYSITMSRPANCPTIPMIFEEHRVAVTPMKSAYRLGSTMEFAGYDTSIRPRRLAILKAGAKHYLHEPHGAHVEEEWYGWRPMTTDSLPIIDRTPAMKNVYIAAGHNMLGLSMGPVTGKLVAELVNEERPHLELRPFRVARF